MLRSAQDKYEAQQNLLAAELKTLRMSVRECAESFALCKEGEIEAMLEGMQALSPRKLKIVADLWSRELRGFKIKPMKGRLKDLKKLEILLCNLSSQLTEAEEALPEKPEKAASGRKQAARE